MSGPLTGGTAEAAAKPWLIQRCSCGGCSGGSSDSGCVVVVVDPIEIPFSKQLLT